MAVRYVLLGGHYRQPLNFTLDSLAGARSALQKLAKIAKCWRTGAPGARLCRNMRRGHSEPGVGGPAR